MPSSQCPPRYAEGLFNGLQVSCISAIELLSDIGLSALKAKDKHNANNAMLSLYTLALEYIDAKST